MHNSVLSPFNQQCRPAFRFYSVARRRFRQENLLLPNRASRAARAEAALLPRQESRALSSEEPAVSLAQQQRWRRRQTVVVEAEFEEEKVVAALAGHQTTCEAEQAA